jgi:hypothetical protein
MNVFTGAVLEDAVGPAQLFEDFPVALLRRDESAVPGAV